MPRRTTQVKNSLSSPNKPRIHKLPFKINIIFICEEKKRRKKKKNKGGCKNTTDVFHEKPRLIKVFSGTLLAAVIDERYMEGSLQKQSDGSSVAIKLPE